MKFEGYKKRTDNQNMDISIIGDSQKNKTETKPEEEKKVTEISDSSKKIKKKPKKSIRRDEVQDLFESDFKIESEGMNVEDNIQKFPLAVKVVLKRPLNLSKQKFLEEYINEVYPVELVFFLYSKLGIVTCIAKAKEEKLTSLQLLHSLFFEDDGHFVIEYLRSKDIVWSNEDERSYSWVNFLAGIFDLAFLDKQVKDNPKEEYYYNPSEVNAETVITRIHNRVLSIAALKYQINSLTQNNQIAPEILENISKLQQFKIVQDKTEIREFNQTIREFFIIGASSKRSEYLQPQTAIMAGFQRVRNEVPMQIPVFNKTEAGTFVKSYKENVSPCKCEVGYYYKMLVERGGFNIRCFIEIGYNYPSVVPNITLNVESVRGSEEEKKVPGDEGLKGANFGYSHILREIEQELVRYWPEYCSEEEKLYLFSYQIKKLTICVEIFVETENEEPTTLYKKGKKGITHSRPFAYNQQENIYEQR